ncbi:hypothetical protein D3C84_1099440 [compost metagenome]
MLSAAVMGTAAKASAAANQAPNTVMEKQLNSAPKTAHSSTGLAGEKPGFDADMATSLLV